LLKKSQVVKTLQKFQKFYENVNVHFNVSENWPLVLARYHMNLIHTATSIFFKIHLHLLFSPMFRAPWLTFFLQLSFQNSVAFVFSVHAILLYISSSLTESVYLELVNAVPSDLLLFHIFSVQIFPSANCSHKLSVRVLNLI
jgi:hypothetical protein